MQSIRLDAPSVLGISVQSSGDAFAFATKERVYLLDFTNSLTPNYECLQDLFSCETCPLAAFNMARLALQIYNVLGFHCIGVDLGTLVSPPTQNAWPPSTFICNRIDPNVNQHVVNSVWFGTEERDLCLRAWLSAW